MEQTQISINPVWPSTLFLCDWGLHGDHQAGLSAHIGDLASGYSTPVASGVATSAKPAKGLVESPLDLFQSSNDPHITALAGWISGCVRAAVSKVNGDQVPPSRLRVEFTESWFHITNDGGFHDAHTHGACSWCGIYYVVAGDADAVRPDGNAVAGNGINRFYSPIGQGGMVRDYGNSYLGRSFVDVQPVNGRLILFPSYLLHSALPYTGGTDRIIVSFNSRTSVAPG